MYGKRVDFIKKKIRCECGISDSAGKSILVQIITRIIRSTQLQDLSLVRRHKKKKMYSH